MGSFGNSEELGNDCPHLLFLTFHQAMPKNACNKFFCLSYNMNNMRDTLWIKGTADVLDVFTEGLTGIRLTASLTVYSPESAQLNTYFTHNLNLTFLNSVEYKTNVRNVHCRKFVLAGTLLKFSNVTH